MLNWLLDDGRTKRNDAEDGAAVDCEIIGVGGNGRSITLGRSNGRIKTGRAVGSGCGSKRSFAAEFVSNESSSEFPVKNWICKQYLKMTNINLNLLKPYFNKLSSEMSWLIELQKSINLSLASMKRLSFLRSFFLRSWRFEESPPNRKNSIAPLAKCPECTSNAVPILGCSPLKSSKLMNFIENLLFKRLL